MYIKLCVGGSTGSRGDRVGHLIILHLGVKNQTIQNKASLTTKPHKGSKALLSNCQASSLSDFLAPIFYLYFIFIFSNIVCFFLIKLFFLKSSKYLLLILYVQSCLWPFGVMSCFSFNLYHRHMATQLSPYHL